MKKMLIITLAAGLALTVAQTARAASITDFVVFGNTFVDFGTNVAANGLVGGNDRLQIGGGSTSSLGFMGGGIFTGGTNVSTPMDIVALGYLDIGGGTHVRNLYSGDYITTGTNVVVSGDIAASRYVVLGGGSAVAGNVQAGGAKPSGLSFETGTNVHVTGNVRADGNVVLAGGTALSGNLDRVGTRSGPGTVVGSDTVVTTFDVAAPSFVAITLPAVQSVSYGLTDVTVSTTAATPLTPGAGIYRDINLGTNKRIDLIAGVYNFRRISAAGGLDLYLDLSGGPITLLVDETVGIGTNLDFFIWDSASASYVTLAGATADPDLRALAGDVFTEVHGTFNVSGGSDWFGTVFTPTQTLTFGTNAVITGALYSGTRVNLGGGSTINFEAANSLLPDPARKSSVVPEPGTLTLIGMGAIGLIGWIRKRRV